MSPVLLLLSSALVAGAIVALSSRDARLALAGLVTALGLAPLIADGTPDPAAAGARIVAAVLAAYLIRVPMRDRPATRGSRIGWPAEALAAAAAFIAGTTAHGVAMPALGAPEATGAGFALLALAAAPFLERTDVLRPGLGLLLALTGAELVRSGLAGSPGGVESIAVALATALAGACIALLAERSVGQVEPGHAARFAGRRR